jgi:hypothetical protein
MHANSVCKAYHTHNVLATKSLTNAFHPVGGNWGKTEQKACLSLNLIKTTIQGVEAGYVEKSITQQFAILAL